MYLGPPEPNLEVSPRVLNKSVWEVDPPRPLHEKVRPTQRSLVWEQVEGRHLENPGYPRGGVVRGLAFDWHKREKVGKEIPKRTEIREPGEKESRCHKRSQVWAGTEMNAHIYHLQLCNCTCANGALVSQGCTWCYQAEISRRGSLARRLHHCWLGEEESRCAGEPEVKWRGYCSHLVGHKNLASPHRHLAPVKIKQCWEWESYSSERCKVALEW